MARSDDTAVAHITDAQFHQITRSQFAVDRQIEQGKFAGSVLDLQADESPIYPSASEAPLSDEFPFIPGYMPPIAALRDSQLWGHKPLRPGQKKVGHVIINRVGGSITEVDLKDHLSHAKFDYCFEKERKNKLFVLTFLGLEFGTRSVMDVLTALRNRRRKRLSVEA
jgi:hypothetical protein